MESFRFFGKLYHPKWIVPDTKNSFSFRIKDDFFKNCSIEHVECPTGDRRGTQKTGTRIRTRTQHIGANRIFSKSDVAGLSECL